MGTQHPGDLRMQEGPLFSNDLKTGSISTKFFLVRQGTGLCPPPAPQSLFVQGTHWTQKH